ncbi:hypothetical protein B0J12DRAFT_639133 [Macrophomina phaseolina]|uniref:MADS-box domain-containing protein n=1 Tax=Macrophomina phaseolina TaxID=35725 RepID=A0ABQ8GY54_9PEZI|nr:hypothetical protein B0J12DRAFT_639133 [Macrophomina phaseolina]
MASAWIKQRRMFDRRRNGLFKKAFEIQRRCQARVYIVMEYEGSYYVYRNSRKTSWPPAPEASELRDAAITLPTDFQTVRDADASGPVSSDVDDEMALCPPSREVSMPAGHHSGDASDRDSSMRFGGNYQAELSEWPQRRPGTRGDGQAAPHQATITPGPITAHEEIGTGSQSRRACSRRSTTQTDSSAHRHSGPPKVLPQGEYSYLCGNNRVDSNHFGCVQAPEALAGENHLVQQRTAFSTRPNTPLLDRGRSHGPEKPLVQHSSPPGFREHGRSPHSSERNPSLRKSPSSTSSARVYSLRPPPRAPLPRHVPSAQLAGDSAGMGR